jgi:uncharacterized membrane protein
MLTGNISLLGWFHSAACIVALVAGAWNLVMSKGTALHRLVGRCYVYTMVAVNLSVFAVYHFDIAHFRPFAGGANTFGIFHWEAVGTLALLGIGVYAAPRQGRAVWAYAHPLAMVLTYYMLVGGLINELFVRVIALRDFAMARAPHAVSVGTTPAVGRTQGLAMLIFIVMLLYFVIKVALHRRSFRKNLALGATA